MRTFILLTILLITIANCNGPINIGNKGIDIKKKEIEWSLIEVYAKRDEYGINCNLHLTIINKNSNIKDLYVEIQAMNKDKKIISVTNFLITQAKKNETINKINTFSEMRSCGKIEDINIFAG